MLIRVWSYWNIHIEKAVIVKSALTVGSNNNITIWEIKKKLIAHDVTCTIFADKKCVSIGSQTLVVADVRVSILLYYYIMIYGSHVVVTAVVSILNVPSDLLFSF